MLRDGFNFGDFLCAIGRHQLRPALRLGEHRLDAGERAALAVSAAPLNSRWGAVRYRAGATGEVT